jgi:hypothetical protein
MQEIIPAPDLHPALSRGRAGPGRAGPGGPSHGHAAGGPVRPGSHRLRVDRASGKRGHCDGDGAMASGHRFQLAVARRAAAWAVPDRLMRPGSCQPLPAGSQGP